MHSSTLKKYTEVIVESGLNLQKGQCLFIACGVDHYDFALLTAKTAYERGARYVDIHIGGTKLTQVRAHNSRPENLSYVPNYATTRCIEQTADDWAQLRIDTTEELDLLANENTSSVEAIMRAERNATKMLSQEMISFRKRWCIVAVPGRKWADKIFGSGDTEANYKKLEDAITKIMRLDSADPVSVWNEHGKMLHNRGEKIKAMSLDKIRIHGKGTDLEIGMIPDVSWKGGLNETSEGFQFIPNLPTEEIFTTPDYTRTCGIAKVTRPVKVLEKTVEGAWFEFKEGKVVNFGAEKNKESLEAFLNVDEGARYLGESALVDSSSPIFQSGIVFNSILYDENAACHIALGKGFASVLPNASSIRTEEDMRSGKCNVSLVHTDFMIGHESINVTGTTNTGNTIEIITNGSFVI